MNKTVHLAETPTPNVVDLSRPVPTRAEKITRTLGVVALVAGAIAAGASAVNHHVRESKGKSKGK